MSLVPLSRGNRSMKPKSVSRITSSFGRCGRLRFWIYLFLNTLSAFIFPPLTLVRSFLFFFFFPFTLQIRVTPVAGRRDAPFNARSGGGLAGAVGGRRRTPLGEREHGARIRDMVMKAAHAGYVEEDEPGGGFDTRVWSNPRASVDSLSRQLRDTWDNFNDNLAMMKGPRRVGGTGDGSLGGPLPEYG